MKVLLVDDEALARTRLRRLLQECPGWEVCAEAADGDSAWALCQTHLPDLLILDIRMPGLDGLQLAHKLATLSPPPAIIFSTAYAEHALHAFQTPATAYLLKPVNRAKLQAALDKVQALNRAQSGAQADAGSTDDLLVLRQGRSRRIPIQRVICVRASHKLSEVVHFEGVDLVEDSLSRLEERFPVLLRVHRQTLVHPARMRSLRTTAGGGGELELDVPGPLIPVSRRLLAQVRRALKKGSDPADDAQSPPTMPA